MKNIVCLVIIFMLLLPLSAFAQRSRRSSKSASSNTQSAVSEPTQNPAPTTTPTPTPTTTTTAPTATPATPATTTSNGTQLVPAETVINREPSVLSVDEKLYLVYGSRKFRFEIKSINGNEYKTFAYEETDIENYTYPWASVVITYVDGKFNFVLNRLNFSGSLYDEKSTDCVAESEYKQNCIFYTEKAPIARIGLSAYPDNVRLSINGVVFRPKTNTDQNQRLFSLRVPVGQYKIDYFQKGYEKREINIDVVSQVNVNLNRYITDLKPGIPYGDVILFNIVMNAKIYIDGNQVRDCEYFSSKNLDGLEANYCILKNVPIAGYPCIVKAPDYKDVEFFLDFDSNIRSVTANVLKGKEANLQIVSKYLPEFKGKVLVNGKQVTDFKNIKVKSQEPTSIIAISEDNNVIYARTYTYVFRDNIIDIFKPAEFYGRLPDFKNGLWDYNEYRQILYAFHYLPKGSEIYTNGSLQKNIVDDVYYLSSSNSNEISSVVIKNNGKILYQFDLIYRYSRVDLELGYAPGMKYKIGDLVYAKDGTPYGLVVKIDKKKREVTVINLDRYFVNMCEREGLAIIGESEEFDGKNGKEVRALAKKIFPRHDAARNVTPYYNIADNFKDGGFNDWYIPSSYDLQTFPFYIDVINYMLLTNKYGLIGKDSSDGVVLLDCKVFHVEKKEIMFQEISDNLSNIELILVRTIKY